MGPSLPPLPARRGGGAVDDRPGTLSTHGALLAAMPSAVIRSFTYRADARELHVLFTTGRRYVYSEVPAEAAEALRAAFAKGRHFNNRIRGRYPYRELEDEVDEEAG